MGIEEGQLRINVAIPSGGGDDGGTEEMLGERRLHPAERLLGEAGAGGAEETEAKASPALGGDSLVVAMDAPVCGEDGEAGSGGAVGEGEARVGELDGKRREMAVQPGMDEAGGGAIGGNSGEREPVLEGGVDAVAGESVEVGRSDTAGSMGRVVAEGERGKMKTHAADRVDSAFGAAAHPRSVRPPS